MKLYLAGSISQNPNYKQQFGEAEKKLLEEGHAVINPVKNLGFSYKDYIDMGLCELMHCEGIYLLEGWEKSDGACLEAAYARMAGLSMLYD